MHIKNILTLVLITFSLVFLFELSLSSCASRVAPSGGPRDTIAPILDTSYPPNNTLNFDAQEVTLEFNEFITVKSPGQQISISPLLKHGPEISTKAKSVNISWEDTLLENTTYIISFGESITDYTEGNVNKKLKYVFSTGDFIDSLSLNGAVIDVETGEAIDQFLICLYDLTAISSSDSIPFNNLPTYYAFTNEQGAFSISNLKYGDFLIVGFEDSRGNFKMNTGSEKTAFLNDTISLSPTNQTIRLKAFKPKSNNRYFGAKHIDYGQIQIAFNYHPSNLSVQPLDKEILDSNSYYFERSLTSDTTSLWFAKELKDSIRLLVKYDDGNVDTSVVMLRKFDKPDFEIELEQEAYKFNEDITIVGSNPIVNIADSLIVVYTESDTIDFEIKKDQENLNTFLLSPKSKAKKYFIKIYEGALKDGFGSKNDSTILTVNTLGRADLGNLRFDVEAESEHSLLLQVTNPDGEMIVDSTFSNNLRYRFKNMRPGVYNAVVIVDEDGDGKWSTGNYLEGKQPELRFTFEENLEIRANWDLELEWILDVNKIQSVKTNPSRSSKN